MYKIAILGCENSHANSFLKLAKEKEAYSDIEVVGVYSNEPEAAAKIKEEFGVYVAESYDEFVGKVDGIIITARDGRNHYKYAKPYIASGIPMFVDKPITSDEKEAVTFMKELKAAGCRVTGGSTCPHAPAVEELAEKVKSGECGKVYGGYLRAPVSMTNNYGNFYFYSQHLTEVMESIFGYYPKSVKTYENGNVITLVVRYDDFDVTASFVDGNYKYYASVSAENGIFGFEYPVTSELYESEFKNFADLLKGEPQKKSYNDFIAPVSLICAIDRALASGQEEAVVRAEEI